MATATRRKHAAHWSSWCWATTTQHKNQQLQRRLGDSIATSMLPALVILLLGHYTTAETNSSCSSLSRQWM
jgi:hypothetical protein